LAFGPCVKYGIVVQYGKRVDESESERRWSPNAGRRVPLVRTFLLLFSSLYFSPFFYVLPYLTGLHHDGGRAFAHSVWQAKCEVVADIGEYLEPVGVGRYRFLCLPLFAAVHNLGCCGYGCCTCTISPVVAAKEKTRE